MKFLFWNTQKKPLTDEIAELIIETGCVIYGFAETSEEIINDVVLLLNATYKIACSSFPTPGCDKIKIIVIGKIDNISLLNQHKHYSLIKVSMEKQELIVGFVHFPSKLYHSYEQIRRVSEILRNQIVAEEEVYATSNSIVIGDFNVNPYETPMVMFNGMAATNGTVCSRRKSVICDGEENKLFYNPMWTLYSSYKDRPGSHRYIRTGEDVVTWHFLDQVIIRPSLIDNFIFESLELIKSTKNFSYLNANKAPELSDHLPLKCEFKF